MANKRSGLHYVKGKAAQFNFHPEQYEHFQIGSEAPPSYARYDTRRGTKIVVKHHTVSNHTDQPLPVQTNLNFSYGPSAPAYRGWPDRQPTGCITPPIVVMFLAFSFLTVLCILVLLHP